MINLNTERMEGNGAENGYNLLHGLNDLCQEYINGNTIMLELGCHQGVSAELFSSYAKKVYTVDVQVCPERLKGISHVEHRQGRFEEVLPTFEECFFDFIYIDGMHDYDAVLQDIQLCLPLLKAGAPLGGHDYYTEVQQSVKAAFKTTPNVFNDSSWVVYP